MGASAFVSAAVETTSQLSRLIELNRINLIQEGKNASSLNQLIGELAGSKPGLPKFLPTECILEGLANGIAPQVLVESSPMVKILSGTSTFTKCLGGASVIGAGAKLMWTGTVFTVIKNPAFSAAVPVPEVNSNLVALEDQPIIKTSSDIIPFKKIPAKVLELKELNVSAYNSFELDNAVDSSTFESLDELNLSEIDSGSVSSVDLPSSPPQEAEITKVDSKDSSLGISSGKKKRPDDK